jgi:hypothetical protein
MTTPREFLAAYHEARRPLSCEIDVQPWNCEFWPYREIDELNAGYKVSTYHLDILGSRQVAAVRCTHSDQVVRSFASISSVSPEEALAIAKDWPSFESMLKPIPLTCVGADGDR